MSSQTFPAPVLLPEEYATLKGLLGVAQAKCGQLNKLTIKSSLSKPAKIQIQKDYNDMMGPQRSVVHWPSPLAVFAVW